MGQVVVVDDNGRAAVRCDVVDVGGPSVSVTGPSGGIEATVKCGCALRRVSGEVVEKELQPISISLLVGVEIDRQRSNPRVATRSPRCNGATRSSGSTETLTPRRTTSVAAFPVPHPASTAIPG